MDILIVNFIKSNFLTIIIHVYPTTRFFVLVQESGPIGVDFIDFVSRSFIAFSLKFSVGVDFIASFPLSPIQRFRKKGVTL
jgi:hypothetical protein